MEHSGRNRWTVATSDRSAPKSIVADAARGWLLAVLPALLLATAPALANDPEQELCEAIEVLKQSGADPAQIRQMEDMLRPMMQQEAAQKSRDRAQAEAEFDEQTAGNGTASVTANAGQYELRVTECTVRDLDAGAFRILARGGPGGNGAELTINGGGRMLPTEFIFSTPSHTYESGNTSFDFDGNVLRWQGELSGTDGATDRVAIHLTCNAAGDTQ